MGLAFLVVPSFLAALFLAITRPLVPPLHRRSQPALMRSWFRILVWLFGLRIRLEGELLPGPALIASNHSSWLDIVVLGAVAEMSFVAKAEIDRWPLIGYVARHGGRTLFIDRGELQSFRNLGGTLIERLREGERVVFFPEGTVSGGDKLRRFKPRLFEAARVAGCRVQPVALRYTGGDGASLAPMMDGDSFVGHLVRVLGARETEVSVAFLGGLESGDLDSRHLAATSQHLVEQSLNSDGRALES